MAVDDIDPKTGLPKLTQYGMDFSKGQRQYTPQGYGKIFSVIFSVLFIFFFPQLTKIYLQFLNSRFSKNWVYIILNLSVHTGITGFCNLIMYLMYISKIPFIEKYRLYPKWPWETEPAKWKQFVKKSLINLCEGHFVLLPILLGIDLLMGFSLRLDLESFPSYFEMFAQTIFFCLVDDFLFYFAHRAMHHPLIYPRIHKIHHEYTISVSIAAEHAHPLEFLLADVLCVIAGVKILGSKAHAASYVLWGSLKIIQAADAHCGYEFSWSPFTHIPWFVQANYHHFHHYQNIGNYAASFTFWETLCGTNKVYYKWLEKFKVHRESKIHGKSD